MRRATQASSSGRQVLSLNLQEDPTIFAFIIDWALTLRLDVKLITNDCQEDDTNEEQLALWCSIHECASRMEMDTLALEVLHQLLGSLTRRQQLPSAKRLTYIYSNTPVDGPIQKAIGRDVVEAFLKASREDVSNQILQWADVVTSHRGLTVEFLRALNGSVESGAASAEPRKSEQSRKRKAADGAGKQAPRPGPMRPKATVVDISDSGEVL